MVFAALSAAVLPAQSLGAAQQNASNPALADVKNKFPMTKKKALSRPSRPPNLGGANPKELAANQKLSPDFIPATIGNRSSAPFSIANLQPPIKHGPINDPASVRILGPIATGYNLCNQRDIAKQIYLRILEIDTKRYGINRMLRPTS